MSGRRSLVIGYGNRRRGDDAAGPLAVEILQRMRLRNVEVAELDGDGIGLIERWTGNDSVVVIDALQSGRRPGEVITLASRELEAESSFRFASTHGVGLSEAVRLARTLGRLPRQLWIVGIEGERFELGATSSEAVRSGARKAARLVAERWGGVRCTS